MPIVRRIERVRDLGRRERPLCQPAAAAHPTLTSGKARMRRVNYDYHRRGAIAYLSAFGRLHSPQVYGRRADTTTTGIAPFAGLVEQVMIEEPAKSADRLFRVVVETAGSYRGQITVDRLTEQFPTAMMVHTPVYARQAEQSRIVLSITQLNGKRCIPNDSMTSSPRLIGRRASHLCDRPIRLGRSRVGRRRC